MNKSNKPKEFTGQEIRQIEMGISVLINIPLEAIGTSMMWDAVESANKLKPILDQIKEMGQKLYMSFYQKNQKTGEMELIPGKEIEYAAAEREINERKFTLSLASFDAKKLEELTENKAAKDHINGRLFLNLYPLLTR